MLNVAKIRNEIKNAKSIDEAKSKAYYLLGFASACERRKRGSRKAAFRRVLR
jgi:hypothetical protein